MAKTPKRWHGYPKLYKLQKLADRINNKFTIKQIDEGMYLSAAIGNKVLYRHPASLVQYIKDHKKYLAPPVRKAAEEAMDEARKIDRVVKGASGKAIRRDNPDYSQLRGVAAHHASMKHESMLRPSRTKAELVEYIWRSIGKEALDRYIEGVTFKRLQRMTKDDLYWIINYVPFTATRVYKQVKNNPKRGGKKWFQRLPGYGKQGGFYEAGMMDVFTDDGYHLIAKARPHEGQGFIIWRPSKKSKTGYEKLGTYKTLKSAIAHLRVEQFHHTKKNPRRGKRQRKAHEIEIYDSLDQLVGYAANWSQAARIAEDKLWDEQGYGISRKGLRQWMPWVRGGWGPFEPM